MAYEKREGNGALFTNNKSNDRQPDWRGDILIGGQLYDIAAWNKTSASGTSFISLKAEPHQDRQQTAEHGYVQGARQVSGQSIYRNPPRQAESFDPQPNDLPFD